jgi:hypothetical protein
VKQWSAGFSGKILRHRQIHAIPLLESCTGFAGRAVGCLLSRHRSCFQEAAGVDFSAFLKDPAPV